MVHFSALTNSSEFWASVRTRQRGDGGLSHAVLYRLDGGQRTLTFRDNAAAAEAFDARLRDPQRTVGRDDRGQVNCASSWVTVVCMESSTSLRSVSIAASGT